MYESAIAFLAVVAGAIATVTGFGIGSILTPVFAARTGAQLAVAAVSIPHFFATLLRFWRLRVHVDRRVLLKFGISELTGLANRYRFSGPVAWVAGALSGFLGGLVGNQGGIRSAALFGFDIDKRAFVATATAVGVIVDAARMPAYFATQWRELSAIWPLILIATIGTVAGTLVGERLLAGIPEKTFRRIVAVLLLVLGTYMLR